MVWDDFDYPKARLCYCKLHLNIDEKTPSDIICNISKERLEQGPNNVLLVSRCFLTCLQPHSLLTTSGTEEQYMYIYVCLRWMSVCA